ncbi:hypothetical protein M8494_35970 [Serratia ureilytica]
MPLSANGGWIARPCRSRRAASARLGGRGRAGKRDRAVFARLLQSEQVFADDDFFALGGHFAAGDAAGGELRRDLGKAGPSAGNGGVARRAVGCLVSGRIARRKSADRSGFDSVLPLRVTEGPTLFCRTRRPVFLGSSAYCRTISISTGRWSVHQSPRPDVLALERKK